MPDNGFEIPINFPLDKSGAVDADKLLAQIRTQVKGVTDETKVYNDWLAKNAKELGDVSKAQAAAATELERYYATLEKMDKAAHEAKAEQAQRIIDLRNTTKVTQTTAQANRDAAQSFTTLAKETEESTKAGSRSNAGFKDAKKAAELLSAQLGPLGQVLRYVFNPGVLGAAVLAKAIGSVWEAFWKFADGVKQSGINAAQGIGNIKGALIELDIERAKADVNFKASLEEFERQSKRKIEVINLEKGAVLQLLEARQKVDLAGAKTPEEERAINERYDQLRRRTIAGASEKELAARQDELNQKESLGKQRYREGYSLLGIGPAKVQLESKRLPGELASLDADIAKAQQTIEQMSSIATPAGAFPYWNDRENYRTQREAYQSEKEKLESLQFLRNKLRAREPLLARASTAFNSSETLLKEVSTGRQQLAWDRQDANFTGINSEHAAAIAGARGPAADMVRGASAGADAILAGGKATPDQAEAINKAAAVLGLVGQSNQTILRILSRMNDTIASFNNSLNAFEQRLETQIRVNNNRNHRP